MPNRNTRNSSSRCIGKKRLSFNMDSGRLDVFFSGYLHHNDKFSNMWKVCKVILMISMDKVMLKEDSASIKKCLWII